MPAETAATHHGRRDHHGRCSRSDHHCRSRRGNDDGRRRDDYGRGPNHDTAGPFATQTPSSPRWKPGPHPPAACALTAASDDSSTAHVTELEIVLNIGLFPLLCPSDEVAPKRLETTANGEMPPREPRR